MSQSESPVAGQPSEAPRRAVLDDESPTRPKRKRLRIGFGVAFALLLLVSSVAIGYLWKLNHSFNQIGLIPSPFPTAENRVENVPESQNFLLIGSDTRGEIGDDLANISGQRADTIMVVHLPGDSSSIQVMSIMRDNWLQLPDGQYAKINAALAYGGVPMLIETVEGLIQDQIDHVAIIDFDGFVGLTNALGGVTINNPVEFSSGGVHFPAGQITLQGDEALQFVRNRYSFTDGDYSRVRNQQIFIKGIISTILSRETLTDPGKIQSMAASIAPYVLTDDGVTSSYLLTEGIAKRNLRPDDVRFFTSPTNGTGTSADGQSIVLPDWDAWNLLGEHFRNDSVATWDPETRR